MASWEVAMRSKPVLALVTAVFLATTVVGYAQTPPPIPVTKGVYRLPYTMGVQVRVSNDHPSRRERSTR